MINPRINPVLARVSERKSRLIPVTTHYSLFPFIAFNTNNFMSKEISGLYVGKGDPSKKKAATLARRRFQAAYMRRNSFSQSLSPMEADDDSSDFDPRAMAFKPTRHNYRSRPARADSSEDFVAPKPKKSRKQPEKGQKKVSDFFSKASPPSPEVSPEPESPNSRGDESELNDFTDRLSMACIGAYFSIHSRNLADYAKERLV